MSKTNFFFLPPKSAALEGNTAYISEENCGSAYDGSISKKSGRENSYQLFKSTLYGAHHQVHHHQHISNKIYMPI